MSKGVGRVSSYPRPLPSPRAIIPTSAAVLLLASSTPTSAVPIEIANGEEERKGVRGGGGATEDGVYQDDGSFVRAKDKFGPEDSELEDMNNGMTGGEEGVELVPGTSGEVESVGFVGDVEIDGNHDEVRGLTVFVYS